MKKYFSLLVLMLASISQTFAYDFEKDDMFYNIVSDNEVYVTFKTDKYKSYENVAYIRSTVTYNDKTYNITGIGDRAFYYCDKLSSVYIDDNVKHIGSFAFFMCSNLKIIELPDGLETLGECAFAACDNLTSLTIPDGVKCIENETCYHCPELKSVTIGASVSSIGSQAFNDCNALQEVHIYAEEPPTCAAKAFSATTYANATLHVPYKTADKYKAADTWKDFANIVEDEPLPISVGGLLYRITSETEAEVVPNSDGYGHNSYSGDIVILSTITFDESTYTVTNIADDAFRESGVTSVSIPSTVVSIGKSAFASCDGLTTLFIPKGITRIDSYAFAVCNGLKSIVVEDSNPNYDSRKGCNAIIETATNTLIAGCKNATIPNGVTSIGDCAFYECFGLTSVTIPNSVTSIGKKAFISCNNLKKVILGNNLKTIGYEAFYNCDITEIYSLNPVPPECDGNSFDYDGILTKATLYVPNTDGALEKYKNTDPWNQFWYIQEKDLTGVTAPHTATLIATPAHTFNLAGQHIDAQQRGIIIRKDADGTARKMLKR